MPRLVRIVCYPGIQPLDVVGPHEVFAGATRHVQDQQPDVPGYRVELVSGSSTTVRGESGLALVADRAIDECVDPGEVDTLVVPGGLGVYEARDDARLISWLREAAMAARRVAAVCTGAFLLAEAGLLDGPGGQSQFSTPSWTDGAERAGIRAARELIHARPGADLSLATLAAHARMSQRNPGPLGVERSERTKLARDVGCPPDRYLERVRVDAARHLLETTVLGTGDVARRAFIRQLGVPPSAYRERFAVAPSQKGS